MAKRVNVDKLAEEYASQKKVKKAVGYTTKLIIVLVVTASILVCSVTALSLYFTGVFEENYGKKDGEEGQQPTEYEGFVDYKFGSTLPKGQYAEIKLLANGTTYTVKAYLFSSYAPNTVANFVSYVNKGFYNGKTFGKVTIGYDENNKPSSGQIICGGYVKNASGEITYEVAEGAKAIKGEFLENGYDSNKLSHTAGVIGMVHGANNDDATTDFYILPYDDTSLNGKYAAFAKITDDTALNLVRSLAKQAYENDLTVTISSIKITTKS